MKLKEQVFEAYRNHINTHMSENRSGAMSMKEDAEHSPLFCGGILEKTPHIPKVFDEDDVELFRDIVKTSCGIFKKVIRAPFIRPPKIPITTESRIPIRITPPIAPLLIVSSVCATI